MGMIEPLIHSFSLKPILKKTLRHFTGIYIMFSYTKSGLTKCMYYLSAETTYVIQEIQKLSAKLLEQCLRVLLLLLLFEKSL